MSDLESCWIFGYGSLLWKIGFEYTVSKKGVIDGWERKFCQGSEDHRGVPGKPGRVVTLVKSSTGSTTGIAYLVVGDQVKNAIDYLTVREKGGYSLKEENFKVIEKDSSQGEQIKVLLYRGEADNEMFIENEKIEDTAAIIATSVGPSGKNCDYLFHLVEWLRENFPENPDPYLERLYTLTKDCLQN